MEGIGAPQAVGWYKSRVLASSDRDMVFLVLQHERVFQWNFQGSQFQYPTMKSKVC
jgi:hypothetical protein